MLKQSNHYFIANNKQNMRVGSLKLISLIQYLIYKQFINSEQNRFPNYIYSNINMEDIGQKQSFLCREIIEAGYSPESFQVFIVAQNPQKGMDLTLYTMNQLKTITTKFKNAQNAKNKPVEVKVQVVEQVKQVKKSTPVVVMDAGKQQDYYRSIQCYKIKTPPLAQNTVIVMDNFEKRQGGLFESSFIVFQVKVEVLKSSVMRRYSDFQWLREMLQILYPGIPIPPIAKKGKLKRKQDKQLIKRMFILQKFLNKLITIPEIRCSDVLYKFLTLKDVKDLENQKSNIKKLKVIPFQKLQNINGYVQLKLDLNTRGFLAKTQKYLISNQPDVKKIYKDFKGAATMLEGCAEHLKSIASNCKSLSKNLISFRKQCELPQTKNNIFASLSQMTQRYSQIMTQQAKIFRKQMYSMVKYESFSVLNLIQNLDKLSQIQQSFIDHRIALQKRKQKLYQQGNVTKWGTIQKITVRPERDQAYQIMLPKQTKQLMKQKDTYALYNYQMYKQIHRYMRQNDQLLVKYFDQIIKLQSNIASKDIMLWADLVITVKDFTTEVKIEQKV